MKSVNVSFDHFGGPEVLGIGEVQLPPPGNGEVQVAIRAVGINPVDWKLVAGYLEPFFPLQLPAIPGCEAARLPPLAAASLISASATTSSGTASSEATAPRPTSRRAS